MLDSIILKDFRSFKGEHRIPLAPLTILVGENSTGKSSFLAAIRLAYDIGIGYSQPNFNESPFSLGSFDDISYYHGGRGQRATSFDIGASLHLPIDSNDGSTSAVLTDFKGTYSRSVGQPYLSGYHIENELFKYDVSFETAKEATDVVMRIKIGNDEIERRASLPEPSYHITDPGYLMSLFLRNDRTASEENPILLAYRYINHFSRSFYRMNRPYAMSPIRTEPDRTYDALQEQLNPDGSHVPQQLARLSARGGDNWGTIKANIEDFGRASGMFDHINIRHLGGGKSKETDPFQIQIIRSDFKGKPNIVDVGYGVSQVIPIIFEIVQSESRDFMLIQQPEVHLHPRAQAELGSFILRHVKPRKRIIVETHSDYFIDRLRMDARDKAGGVPSQRYKDLVILYFSKDNDGSHVTPIKLTREGELADIPVGWREFFMEEEMRFIGL